MNPIISTSVTNENVCCILRELAQNVPCRPAIIDCKSGTRVASFSQLDDEVSNIVEILKKQGVKSLDVVLIYVPLQRELISLLLAVFRLGAQAMFIDPGYSVSKILHCLKLARPAVLILDPRLKFLGMVAPLFGIRRTINFQDIADGLRADTGIIRRPSDVVPAAVERDHPALITFTSGSTGMPKGIVRSHGFLTEQAKLLRQNLPPETTSEYSQVLTTLPMFILSTLAAGDTAIIAARGDGEILQQLKYLAPDRLLCAPNSLAKICKLLSNNAVSQSSIKDVVVGGGPVFPELLTKLREVMPDVVLTTVYGSTEAEPICHRQYRKGEVIVAEQGLPLGKQIEGIDLRIIDSAMLDMLRRKNAKITGPVEITAEDCAKIAMPQYCEGEIVVSGAHVIKGYLGGYGDNQTKFTADGVVFHRTGDAGFRDASGALVLTGRISAGVKLSGRTTYPLTAELLAMENRAVEKCAFVEIRGKGIVALSLKDKSNHPETLAALKSAFALADIPVSRFVILDELPVDERHQSKIVYSKLKRRLRFAA